MSDDSKFKFVVGQSVRKTRGYKFPGTVVSVFRKTTGEARYVVELDDAGLLHIFNGDQLEVRA